MAKKQAPKKDIADDDFIAGYNMVHKHPIFGVLISGSSASISRKDGGRVPKNGLAVVNKDGEIFVSARTRATPAEWARALAHCLLHLAMGHFVKKDNPLLWNMACDIAAEKFLNDMKFGPTNHSLPVGIVNLNDENKIYEYLCREGAAPAFMGFGTAGENVPDMLFTQIRKQYSWNKPTDWQALFAKGLRLAVRNAVSVAAGAGNMAEQADERRCSIRARQAKEWFISSYPLLGALAASFKIIEEPLVCQRMDIHIAAVSAYLGEIYMNPAASLNEAEYRFVIAHEILHVALRHDARHEWHDRYLWNVACDFVINGWLIEMQVGECPAGLLHDEQFKGLSAEEVYDRIATDMRMYRKLATLRGVGLGDILDEKDEVSFDTDLDTFYRRAISQGLQYHQEAGRGYLPAGLVEEIRALCHPPIPWDVELAKWFDDFFQPLEKTRTYSRPSRRQSSTPDIPRPNWYVAREALARRTFGVVLDTSGSMDRALLGVGLGAIASYSIARDVPAVRVVFCDADAYDQGYMKPDDIADTVKVKGRGGTILQPGIEMLLNAEDFPKDAPILLITDGYCENRLVFGGREHAFLMPESGRLPFLPKGKVFRMKA
jgi:predicted metal-dependent peptidase